MNDDRQVEPRRGRRIASGSESPSTSKPPVNFLDERQPKRPKARSRFRRVIFLCIMVLIALFFLGRIVSGLTGGSTPDDPVEYDPVTLEVKKPEGFLKKISHIVFSREKTLEGHKDDRINLLLLGMGGPGHDGPYLTDTIILASIQPSTGQIAMISIPRDLGVKIPGRGWYKINHANAFGEVDNPGRGGDLALEVVEDTFDENIPYYVRVDFQAFKELVDIVGGVTVDVDRSFVDEEYPAPNEQYQTVQFQKGIETMSGARALTYARSRHGNNGEGSDFARARRQQKVLLALKEKLFSYQTLLNPLRINNIIKSLGDHMTTNMSFSDIITLIRLGKNLDNVTLNTVVLDVGDDGYLDHGYTEAGAYILQPKEGNFKQINRLVENVFTQTERTPDTTPEQDTPKLSPANVEIQNATWRAGLAARIRQRLRNKNVIISEIGNTEERPLLESGIYTVSETVAPDVVDVLQNALGVAAKETMPAGEAAATTTDILVILGEDFVE